MFDILGFLILIALTALFAFLTRRAWKLKNPFLKWLSTIPAALLTVIGLLLLVLASVGFYKLNQRHDNPAADIHVAGTPAQIARGAKLAQICVSCHTENGQLPLSGSNFLVKFGLPPLGTLYAPNLTPSGNIKDWTDGQVIRAIREGVHPDGRSLLIMPATDFHNMSDDDVQAVVAYLRSQPAVGGPTPANQFSLLGALFINLSDFRTAQPPEKPVPAPQPGTPGYGKYLVDIIGCRACHGEQLQGRIDNGQPGLPAGPNLTVVVPQWSQPQFMTFFNSGVLPSGKSVPTLTLPSGFTEPRMPWPMVRAVASDQDLQDIYDYLHSLPPIAGPTK